MSAPWFHLDPLPGAGEIASLGDEETRHARGARRLRAGDPVVVFDGAGRHADATLLEISKRAITLEVHAARRQPLPVPDVHLASALPKGDRAATLLGMGTQLGMRSFTPLACERSVIVPSAGQHARWSRILREACKQSRRAHVPELRAPAQPVAAVVAPPAGARRLVLDPEGIPAARWLRAQSDDDDSPIQLLVGPEGGFSAEERAALIAGDATPVRIADAILRIETAALAGLSIVGLLREAPAPDAAGR